MPICRECRFTDIYVLRGSVATLSVWCACRWAKKISYRVYRWKIV